MSFDATERYLIPPRSWVQAQQPPAIRFRIGKLVVEESAIEFWDRQHIIQCCNFMNKGRGGRILYHWEASVMANNPLQRASESVLRLWSNPPSSKILPAWYLIHPLQKTANSWVMMRQRRILYRWEAGIKPNNLLQRASKSVYRSWSNLPSSKVSQAWDLIYPPQKTANS